MTSSTGFDVFVNAQLAALHDKLIAEHRHHVSRLQNQVMDLMAENAVLCRSQTTSPRGSAVVSGVASTASPRGSAVVSDASPRDADVAEISAEEGDASDSGASPKSSKNGIKAADSKKPDESIPGTVNEEIFSETLSNGPKLPDGAVASRGGGDGRAPPLAWGAQAKPSMPQQPAPSGAPNVLPPIGQPQELVVRPGLSTLQKNGPRYSPQKGSRNSGGEMGASTLATFAEDQPAAVTKMLSASKAEERRTSTMQGGPRASVLKPSPGQGVRTSVLKGSAGGKSTGAQGSRPPRASQRVSILGAHHPDAETSSKTMGDSKEKPALGTTGFSVADSKRISFQAGTGPNALHEAHEIERGPISEGRNNQSVIGSLDGFSEAQSSKRGLGALGGPNCPHSGIDRLSPLKRHSAMDGDLGGLRRGSLGMGGRRQSSGNNLAPVGDRRQSNLGVGGIDRRTSLAQDRRQSNLRTPGDFGRSRGDSVISMFGGNNSWGNDCSDDYDRNGGNGAAFRPSRQRMSNCGLSEEMRLSVARARGQETEGGVVKFEVAQAWVLGRFGNSMRRSSMGGAARMSQFMDHFLDKDEKAQEQAEVRDGAKIGCNKYLQSLVIHPNSGKHVSWDFLGLILIAYDAVMVPLEIFQPPQSTFSTYMDWTIRLFWTLNILVTFCTGILRDDGVVEMRPRRIARHYIFTWLPLDIFLSIFDWIDLVFQGVASEGLQRFGASWLRALRMVRSARLIRLLRAPEIAKKLTELIPFHEWLGLIATVVKIMLIFLWIAHAVACIWFGVGRYMCGHGSCWITEGRYEKTNWGQQYALSLHWSLSALSGDTSIMDPENIFERVYAMAILYLAFVISASYVGSITTTMTNIHMMASEQSSKLSVLRRFLLDHGISRTLAVRVQRNAQHAMIEHKSRAPESSVELLGMISQPLLVEVHYEIYSRGIMVHPFFHCYERVNPAGIRKICHTAITMLSLHTKDVLFSDLEVAEKPRTFFLISGKLQYMHDMKVSPVMENHWMCEHALWTTWTHCGTARATTETRLLCLDAEKWQETVCTFPTDHACVYAAEFVSWLNADADRARSDMGPPEAEITEMLLQAFPAEDDEELDDEDDDDRPRSREGSFIANVPGLNALAELGRSPHASARLSSRGNNSVLAGIINVFTPAMLGEKRQSLHRSRASAHQLATEKMKACQRRSSMDATKGPIVIPDQVGATASLRSSMNGLSPMARCQLFVKRCCMRLFGCGGGGGGGAQEETDRTSIHSSPAPSDDASEGSAKDCARRAGEEPEALFQAVGTAHTVGETA